PAIVENRLGGNGIIATEAVAKSRADGYTLIMGNHSTLAILPHITKIGYDPEKDLADCADVGGTQCGHRQGGVAGDIDAGTRRLRQDESPDKCHASIGASGHLIGEQFKQLTGVDLVHVHYRGAALALQDVVAGHVDMMFDVVALTREHALSGQVRALA